MLKYILLVLMFAGLFHALYISRVASEVPVVAEPVASPAKISVSDMFIAGAGLIEPGSELIEIASPVAGLVSRVFVETGQTVRAGDALFEIDTRARAAELVAASAAVQVASAQLQEAASLFALVESSRARQAQSVSREQFETRKGAVEVARASLEKAKAEEQFVKAELDRLTVRAPVDGQILQRKIRAGEFAAVSAAGSNEALMILGDVSNMHVRTDVDENDAWRFREGAKAEGFIRGNPQLKLSLEFVRIEPYVIPKRSLNGGTTERVDTRVLQIIYRITSHDSRPYVGQLVDVYIASD